MIDHTIAGRELPGAVSFPIERSKLVELAHALHDADRAWHDLAAATAAGFEGVPTPPTVTTLADHWREGGALAVAVAIGVDVDRVLHGEVAWEYLHPVRLGDELHARTRVTSVTDREGRRGGTMTLVGIETEFVNQHGVLAVRRRDTIIETGSPK